VVCSPVAVPVRSNEKSDVPDSVPEADAEAIAVIEKDVVPTIALGLDVPQLLPHEVPQLLPQLLAIYGPHSVPDCPLPVTV